MSKAHSNWPCSAWPSVTRRIPSDGPTASGSETSSRILADLPTYASSISRRLIQIGAALKQGQTVGPEDDVNFEIKLADIDKFDNNEIHNLFSPSLGGEKTFQEDFMAFVAQYDTASDPRTARVVYGDKIDFPMEKFVRGENLPPSAVPRQLFLMNGVKELPDIVALLEVYWIVSRSGKEFLEENAPNQCEFIPTEVWRNKKAAARRSETSPDVRIEKDYFWLNIMRRFDAIDWDQSQAEIYEFDGEDWDTREKKRVKRVKFPRHPKYSHLEGYGLTVRKDVIGDSQIWRDNFLGAGFVGLTFMSDDLKSKIEKNRMGRIVFIPVKEV